MNTSFNPFLLIVACAIGLLAACQTTSNKPPDRFAEADTNRDGSLSRAEVAAYFSDSLFDAADANKDSNLTEAEWTSSSSASSPAQFRSADRNRDGMVTRDEAHTYARQRPTIEEFMKGADTNKDGSLSREEAKAYYASREGPVR